MTTSTVSDTDIVQRIITGSIDEHVVSYPGRSQYSRIGGGVSACGLAALNCARIVLDLERKGLRNEHIIREMMKRETLEEVLRPCLSWSSPAHLDVDEIYRTPIFHKSFKLLASEYARSGMDQFVKILSLLAESTKNTRSSTCAIITRPPEIVACFKLATNESDIFVIFDSHPRPEKHPHGAAFIFLCSVDSAAAYLSQLLRYDANILMEKDVQWQAQLLAHFSAHIFTARHTMGSTAELAEATLEASLDVLNLRAQVLELESQNGQVRSENEDLLHYVAFLEDQVAELQAKSRRDELRLRSLDSANKSEPNRKESRKQKRIESKSNSSKTQEHRTYSSVVSGTSSNDSGFAGPSMDPQKAAYEAAVYRKWNGNDSVPKDDFAIAAIIQMQADQMNNSDALYAAAMQRDFDDEDHQLRKELHELKRTVPSNFECGICFDTFSEDVVARVEPCGHKFCRECLNGYAVGKIEEHRFPIICPLCMAEKGRQDAGVVDDLLIQQLGLSEKQYEIFIEMQMAAFSIILHCRQCKNSAFVDKKEYEATQILVCPVQGCNHTWCKMCSQKVEVGGPKHSCDGSSELEDLMKKRGWKHCPGCQTPAEKIDGCNHMTCTSPGCNTHFCYVCGAAIIRSVKRNEIQAALATHYRACRLF